MKNLNFCIKTLKEGGYFCEYQNYSSSGYGAGIGGTSLLNKDGRPLLDNVRKEFIEIKKNLKLREVKWQMGTEHYLED